MADFSRPSYGLPVASTHALEETMIDGLRLDVTADEIVRLLDERIAEHSANAVSDDQNAQKLDALKRPDDVDDEIWEDDSSAVARLRRRAQRERERSEALTFMRGHVIRGETYRLSTEDLRTLEILDGRPW
jgi:hypothetical protein